MLAPGGGWHLIQRADTGERFLDARAVAERYGITDPRAARRVMRGTGEAFTVARRLVVSLDALRAWERRQQARERGEWERPATPREQSSQCPMGHSRGRVSAMADTEPARWWDAA